MAALMARPFGLAHHERDNEWIAQHRNTEWHWAERGGKIVAYVGCGRGIDMQDIVHEWGAFGPDLSLLAHLVHRVAHGRQRCFVLTGREVLQHYAIANDAFDPMASRDTLAGVGLRDAVALSLVLDPEAIAHVPTWFWGLDAV